MGIKHILFVGATALTISSCGVQNDPIKTALTAFKSGAGAQSEDTRSAEPTSLASLISTSRAKVNVNAGFKSALRDAIMSDPSVIALKSEAQASKAKVKLTESGKDLTFDATVLGGVEDVTDETAGVAAILKARRLVFDGGQLAARIEVDKFNAQAADAAVLQQMSQRGASLAHAWIELERYRALDSLIQSRLSVLDPLLVQLERVAKSGMGDVRQVAAAQRTVSMIRVTQTDVTEKLEQAKVSFLNGFGQLPPLDQYPEANVAKFLPLGDASKLALSAPGLLAKYYGYRSAEANVVAIEALNNPTIGFEMKMQRPFGGSGLDSDESIGLVLTKKFYRGEQLSSQIDGAQEIAKAKADEVRSTYREGAQLLDSSRQFVESMGKAIALAQENARITREEIDYLRKQLVIGGSTLDSVLSAEARLYDAEAQEIGFLAEKRKAEVNILAVTGRLLDFLALK